VQRVDAPEPTSPLPKLPANLDDQAALDSWQSQWNAWIADEGVRHNWPWLQPISAETLREIVEEERQLRADMARGQAQFELETARNDLNTIDTHLRATDPQFPAKSALLVPILRPIFRHIPPSKWKELFQEAYAQLQVPAASSTPEEQREITEARGALNTIERRLRAQDPAYEAKKAFLLPIVQPLFKQMPPSKWAETFEETYAGVRLPTDSTIPPQAEATSATRSEGDVLLRDAKPQVLDGRITTTSGPECIERDCGTYWLKDIEEWNRAYLEQEMNRWVLPDLRRKALNDNITVQQYRDIVAAAWMVIENLFYALHYNARASWHGYHSIASGPAKPKFFWLHQGLEFLRLHDMSRGFAISKDDLAVSAANYLKHPEVSTNHFDWLYLDALIFSTMEIIAEELFVRRMGTGTNWAAVFARRNALKYASFRILFGALRFTATYVWGPAASYYLHKYGHDAAAMWTVGLWGAAIIFSWTTYPLRWRIRRKGQRLLTHLLELNRMLGDKTISPRKLREKMDAATADGIAFDGAVMAIVDRMVARDPAAFIHLM
jgi:hypothetical protein